MADYYAVLNRTLSGFPDPKPDMRQKLYERARQTIARQLDLRNPPVGDEMRAQELDKLEQAIGEIEAGYVQNELAVDGSATSAGEVPTPDDPVMEAAAEPVADDRFPEPDAAESEPVPLPPVTEPVFDAGREGVPGLVDEAHDAAEEPAVQPLDLPRFDPAASPATPDVDLPAETPDALVDEPDAAVAQDDASAIDDWAKEFLEANPADVPNVDPTGSSPEVGDSESLRDTSATKTRETPVISEPVMPLPAAVPLSTPAEPRLGSLTADDFPAHEPDAAPSGRSDRPASDLPGFEAQRDDNLVIPPAPGIGGGEKKRSGIGKWIFFLLLLLLLLAAGAVVARMFFGMLQPQFQQLGIERYFAEGVTPTPVKTITITPDPEPEPEVETPVPEPVPEPEQPKSEDRLGQDTDDGDSVAPTIVPDADGTTPQVEPDASTTPAPEPDAQSESAAEPAIPAAEAGAVPVVAQSAILYEEGATAGENNFEAGRVTWSKIDEPTGEGEATEPAIRARMEIPSRNLVMLMTLKRNNDRALPASHLIEIVFATPDDFVGGSISEINRFVLKENEQGRGDALVGVPARIADGIFLIALNNLDEARSNNETLLQSRNWIDIPVQYATGRRALLTMEKGVPGDQVFKEVFDAWKAS